MRKIILASASPRRSELMKQAGLDFDVCVSTKEEKKGRMIRMLSGCFICCRDEPMRCIQVLQ